MHHASASFPARRSLLHLREHRFNLLPVLADDLALLGERLRLLSYRLLLLGDDGAECQCFTPRAIVIGRLQCPCLITAGIAALLLCRRWAPSLRRRHAFDVDATEQHRELRRIELNLFSAWRDLRQAEAPVGQPFVIEDEAAAIPAQDFHAPEPSPSGPPGRHAAHAPNGSHHRACAKSR